MFHPKLKKYVDKTQFLSENGSKYKRGQAGKSVPHLVSTRYYGPVQTNLPGRPFDLSYSWHFRSKAEQFVSDCTIILLQYDLQSLIRHNSQSKS